MFECIPNISEGRNESVIEEAKKAVEAASGVTLLHTDVGFDANRTVFTFIGNEEGIEKAIVGLYNVCLTKIDLRNHLGAHPRLGAVDVCPIVPLDDSNFVKANALVRKIAGLVSEKFQIPVYLYEQSQDRDYRKKLSAIRRGQFEGLTDKIKMKEWYPDFGPNQPHPSFGATVIGARDFLIAFNVSLESKDLNIANEIAKILREYRSSSDHSFADKWQGVRAMGWEMPHYNCVQVSTNLVDMERINLAEVYLEIEKLAQCHGVKILGTELIGLVPTKALVDAAKGFGGSKSQSEITFAIEKLNLSYHSKFDPAERILENHF